MNWIAPTVTGKVCRPGRLGGGGIFVYFLCKASPKRIEYGEGAADSSAREFVQAVLICVHPLSSASEIFVYAGCRKMVKKSLTWRGLRRWTPAPGAAHSGAIDGMENRTEGRQPSQRKSHMANRRRVAALAMALILALCGASRAEK